jgi:hypothetical protein
MAVRNSVDEKRYMEPCFVDGRYFRTIAEAWRYLQEVNGRIHIDRLERHLRQGRRVLEGHIICNIETIAGRQKESEWKIHTR